MAEQTKSKEAQDVAEEQEPKTRVFRLKPTVIPFTCNMSMNIPDYAGNPIPYSSYFTGFTQIPFEVEAEIEVEVPDTGDTLHDFTEAMKKLGMAIFQANVELQREVWIWQRDAAKEALLEEPL